MVATTIATTTSALPLDHPPRSTISWITATIDGLVCQPKPVLTAAHTVDAVVRVRSFSVASLLKSEGLSAA